jgi:nitronate monooxygenase
MKVWRDQRILDLFGIELHIILAPMAGPGTAAPAIAVSEAGGSGSLPCAQLGGAEIRTALETIRRGASRPMNLNFFCHTPPIRDQERELAWRALLSPIISSSDWIPKLPLPLPPVNPSMPNRAPS